VSQDLLNPIVELTEDQVPENDDEVDQDTENFEENQEIENENEEESYDENKFDSKSRRNKFSTKEQRLESKRRRDREYRQRKRQILESEIIRKEMEEERPDSKSGRDEECRDRLESAGNDFNGKTEDHADDDNSCFESEAKYADSSSLQLESDISKDDNFTKVRRSGRSSRRVPGPKKCIFGRKYFTDEERILAKRRRDAEYRERLKLKKLVADETLSGDQV